MLPICGDRLKPKPHTPSAYKEADLLAELLSHVITDFSTNEVGMVGGNEAYSSYS